MNLISIMGPTASGKTKLAVSLALRLGREIISADSRQVYKGMDIGTGKDLDEYVVDGVAVPVHLVDICEAGYKYNLFEYQQDFLRVYNSMENRGVSAILCGGSGMYVDAVVQGYELFEVPADYRLRQELEKLSLKQLTDMLSELRNLHANSDTDTKKRAIRAIEIEEYYKSHPRKKFSYPKIDNTYIGINIDREIRREKISKRLKERLEHGMIDEVRGLMESVSADDLIFYGLEYKFVTRHILGELTYKQMEEQLETAIHQFAKRQMTWFRSMERKGAVINWVDHSDLDTMINRSIEIIERQPLQQ